MLIFVAFQGINYFRLEVCRSFPRRFEVRIIIFNINRINKQVGIGLFKFNSLGLETVEISLIRYFLERSRLGQNRLFFIFQSGPLFLKAGNTLS